METVKIKVHLSIGYANASHDDVIEVEIPEDASEDEANELKEQACQEWANNYMDLGWADA